MSKVWLLIIIILGTIISVRTVDHVYEVESLAPAGVYPFLVVFWNASMGSLQKMNFIELHHSFPLVGTIINERYVLTLAYQIQKNHKEAQKWLIVGAGMASVPVDLAKIGKSKILSFHFNPKFDMNSGEIFDISNICLVKSEKPLLAPGAMMACSVRFSNNLERYPDQTRRPGAFYSVFWVLTDANVLQKHAFFYDYGTTLEEFVPPEKSKQITMCPKFREDGYMCLKSSLFFFTSIHPCFHGSVSIGGPIIVENELHGVYMGYSRHRRCRRQFEDLYQPEILLEDPQLGLSVVNVPDSVTGTDRETRDFIHSVISTNRTYSNFDLYGKFNVKKRKKLRGGARKRTTESSANGNASLKRPRVMYPKCFLNGTERNVFEAKHFFLLITVIISVYVLFIK